MGILLNDGLELDNDASILHGLPYVQEYSQKGMTMNAGTPSYVDTYRAPDMEIIRIVRTGIPAADVLGLIRQVQADRDWTSRMIGLSRSTIVRKARKGERLAPAETERYLGLVGLIGQVQAMVETSGRPEGFDAASWLGRWLERPIPALGGLAPWTLMDTAVGRQLVAQLLQQIESGTYA